MVPPLCRTPLEMESRKMFPWCDLDILRALWRSTMFPCQRQCRRQESGKVGIPVSNHNPQLLFGPHPAQSQSTQRLPYSDPDRFQLLFALTHFVSLWFQEPENVWVPWKQLEAMQNAANLAFAQLFPAPVCPNTKLSGRNSWPKGPARTLSMVPATTSVGLKQSGQRTATQKPQSLFGFWLPRMLADVTPMRHQFHSIPTSDMCECAAESHCPTSAEMYLLKTSWIMLQLCSGQCTWLEVHQNSTWHIAATCCLVEVNVDALLAAMQSRKANHRHQGYTRRRKT